MQRQRLVILLLLCSLVAAVCWPAEQLRCAVCGKTLSGTYYKIKRDGKVYPTCPACVKRMQEEKERHALRCAVCGQKISGQYVKQQRDGKTVAVCMRCAKRALPKCAKCGKPLTGEYYRVQQDGKTIGICKECMRKNLPTCAICGKRISGPHLSHDDGSHYCAECAKLPRCKACGRPLAPGKSVTKGGESFCEKCAPKVLLCSCCGQVIKGKYFYHPFTPGVFCARCEAERPKCVSCERPIRADPIMVGGKRPMCPECFRCAVLTQKRAYAILQEAQKIILDALGESTYHDLPVTLVDDIAEVQKGTVSSGKERGLFKRKGETFNIYIQYGLSEPLSYETLPHEWAHAWFAENGNPLHPQWVEEGFCQWIASHVLRHKGFERGLKILATRDDLYGKGYRYIKAIEDEGDKKAVLRYVRTRPAPGKPIREAQ